MRSPVYLWAAIVNCQLYTIDPETLKSLVRIQKLSDIHLLELTEIPGTHFQRLCRPQGKWFCRGNHGKNPQ